MASMLRLPAQIQSFSDKYLGSTQPLQHPTESKEVEPVLLDRPMGESGAYADALGGQQSEAVEGSTLLCYIFDDLI